ALALGICAEAPAIAAPYETASEHLHDELQRLNVRVARLADDSYGSHDEDWRSAHEVVRLIDAHVAARLDASRRAQIDLPLPRLARLFQLTRFETEALLVALAPEIDRRYEKLYGYLQDDITGKRPTAGLLLDL